MIPGFNTDIEYQGTVYHVQTEDKGVDNPLILSLIYTGGRILASKRTFYHELIAAGFNERLLIEKLNRQHKLICAAILAGRIQDLIAQSERELQNLAAQYAPEKQIAEPKPPHTVEPSAPTLTVSETPFVAQNKKIPPRRNEVPVPRKIQPNEIKRPVSNLPSRVPPATARAESGELHEPPVKFTLVHEVKLIAGQAVELKFNVSELKFGRYLPAVARVHVKLLGTSFLPQSYVLKTDSSGFVTLKLELPNFNSGRAALVAQAESAAGKAELRRIIHMY